MKHKDKSVQMQEFCDGQSHEKYGCTITYALELSLCAKCRKNVEEHTVYYAEHGLCPQCFAEEEGIDYG